MRQFDPAEAPEPQVFVDFRQWPGTRRSDAPRYFALRTYGDVTAITAELRNVVRAVDARAGLFNVDTLETIVANALARQRLYAVLFGLFATLAVALAAIGIYGVIDYSVAQRRCEIGIRMALGARPSAVLALVLGRTAILTGAGVLLGLAGAGGVTRYFDWMLFGLTPLDPTTFSLVPAMFTVVATLATVVPARRATRVDPVIALRAD